MGLRFTALCLMVGRLALAQTGESGGPLDCGSAHASATLPAQANFAGRFMDAEASAMQLLRTLECRCEPTSPILLGPLSTLAVARLELGKLTAARATVDQIGRLHIQRPEQRAIASAVRALLLHTEGRLEEAEREYRDSYSHFERAGLAGSASAGAVLNGLGAVLIAQDRLDEARGALDGAIAILGGAHDATAGDLVRALTARASLHARHRAWHDAERDLREAVSIATDGKVPDTVLQNLLTDFSLVLRKDHRVSEARALEARAAAMPRMHAAKSLVDAAQLARSIK